MPVKKNSKKRKTQSDAKELRFEDLVESLPHMVFVKDAKELRFVHFNKAGEDLLGIKRSAMLGKNDYDFFPKEQADFFIKKDTGVLKSKKKKDIPMEPIDTPNGKRFLHTVKVPILDANGKPAFLLGISEDITEKIQTETSLKEARTQFELAFENAPIGIALVSPEGAFMRVNKRLSEIVGYTQKTLLKKTFQDITHPDDLEADLHYVEEMLAGKRKTYQMEKRYIAKNKKTVWILLSVSLVHNEDGTPKHFISHIQDISKIKEQEEEMRDQLEEFEKLNALMLGREEKMIEMKQKLRNQEKNAS